MRVCRYSFDRCTELLRVAGEQHHRALANSAYFALGKRWLRQADEDFFERYRRSSEGKFIR